MSFRGFSIVTATVGWRTCNSLNPFEHYEYFSSLPFHIAPWDSVLRTGYSAGAPGRFVLLLFGA